MTLPLQKRGCGDWRRSRCQELPQKLCASLETGRRPCWEDGDQDFIPCEITELSVDLWVPDPILHP